MEEKIRAVEEMFEEAQAVVEAMRREVETAPTEHARARASWHLKHMERRLEEARLGIANMKMHEFAAAVQIDIQRL